MPLNIGIRRLIEYIIQFLVKTQEVPRMRLSQEIKSILY